MSERHNNGYINPFEIARCDYNFDTLYMHYFKQVSELIYNTICFDGLPNTISEAYLKYCIFLLGKAVFFRDGDNLLALNASPSNTPDVYYVPTDVIVANPVIGSKTLRRDVDCVVVYCTSMDRYTPTTMYGGLYTLVVKTATMLADNDLSINIAQKNTRLVNILGIDDSIGKRTIDDIMQRMYAGEPYQAVQTRYVSTLQAVPVQTNANNQHILQLIELHQYILAHFYEQIGLTTHDQIKKERLITAEINDNTDMALYNIQYVLRSIQDGINAVNAMFGTNITVYLNPILEAADGEPDPEPEEEPEEAADGEPESEPEEEPEEAADGEPESEPEEEPEEAADGEPESEPEEEPEEAADGEPESEPEEEPEEAADSEPESEPEEEPEEAADGEPDPEPEEEPELSRYEEILLSANKAAYDEYQAKKQVVINISGDNADVEVVTDANDSTGRN